MLFKIREGIVKNGDAWMAARDNRDFRRHFTLEGDSLANAPRGFAKDHPLMEDLKRKDFVGLAAMSDASLSLKNFRPLVVERFMQAAPYMRFLCEALELPF